MSSDDCLTDYEQAGQLQIKQERMEVVVGINVGGDTVNERIDKLEVAALDQAKVTAFLVWKMKQVDLTLCKVKDEACAVVNAKKRNKLVISGFQPDGPYIQCLFECQFITVCNMFILIKCIVCDEINQYQTNYIVFHFSLWILDIWISKYTY